MKIVWSEHWLNIHVQDYIPHSYSTHSTVLTNKTYYQGSPVFSQCFCITWKSYDTFHHRIQFPIFGVSTKLHYKKNFFSFSDFFVCSGNISSILENKFWNSCGFRRSRVLSKSLFYQITKRQICYKCKLFSLKPSIQQFINMYHNTSGLKKIKSQTYLFIIKLYVK